MNNAFALKGNILYTPVCGRIEAAADSYLVCEEGKVAGVFDTLPEAFWGVPVEDFGSRLILPGLADLHVHASQYAYRGLGMDLELLDWLEQNAFPEEARFADLDYARAAWDIFVEELAKSATTRACIFATVHRPAALLLIGVIYPTFGSMPGQRPRTTFPEENSYAVAYSPSQSTLRNFMGSVLPSVENRRTWLNRSSSR